MIRREKIKSIYEKRKERKRNYKNRRDFYRFFLGKGNKRKNKQMGLSQTKKFLYSKRNHQQNEKKTHYMGEHIYEWHI